MAPRTLVAFLLLGGLTAVTKSTEGPEDPFKSYVERNIRLLAALSGCQEGFARAVAGETISYPRMRGERAEALLSRATTGAMGIAWQSGTARIEPGRSRVEFVVAAGFDSEPTPGHSFRMYVNGIQRFTLSTGPDSSWVVRGAEGATVHFDGVMRDHLADVFGYLRIGLPTTWLVPGEGVEFRIEGERAGSSAWFIVYKDPDLLPFLREKVESEAWLDLLVEPDGEIPRARVTATSRWAGRRLEVSTDGRVVSRIVLAPTNPSAGGESQLAREVPERTLGLALDGEPLAEVRWFARDFTESSIHPRKLVRVTGRTGPDGSWTLEYRSSHLPRFGTSILGLSGVSGRSAVQHMIVSAHQEVSCGESLEQCAKDRDEKVITPALVFLQSRPDYHFDLEDVHCLREYLERHPERRGLVHRLAKDGRLTVGATYNQPYEDLCSAEMLVRQFYAGRKWFRRNFPGCDTRTAWNPDVPGRTAQMPQILRRAGVRYLVIGGFARGLFRWSSPEGSNVLAFSPGPFAAFKDETRGRAFPEVAGTLASSALEWMKLVPSAATEIPVLSMSDTGGPDPYDDLIEQWNSLKRYRREDGSEVALTLPPVRNSSMERYLDEVSRSNPKVPELRGERPNVWVYLHGPEHHRAISAKREADVLLPAAEAFATIDALLAGSFKDYPQARLASAWEAQIHPDHGWGGRRGSVTEAAFLAKYESARDSARSIFGGALSSIAGRVKIGAARGVPVVVFNDLSWERSGPVRSRVEFDRFAFPQGLRIVDAAGIPAASQVLDRMQYPDGSLREADIVFVARDVPPLGYASFYIQPAAPQAPGPKPVPFPVDSVENSFYRVTIGRGGARQILDKELEREILDTTKFFGGELFAMRSVGEEAGGCAEPQQPVMQDLERMSNHNTVWRLVETGAVRTVVEARQRIDHATAVERLVLYHTLKRIDFEASLLNWDGARNREFRLAFPVRSDYGQVSYEVPFGVLETGMGEIRGAAGGGYPQQASKVRPRSIQNWIGASDDSIGVTLSSSVAVWDYLDPTENPLPSPVLQPVLLASRRSCDPEGPWHLQEGDHNYNFSLTSHLPGWRNGRRFGLEVSSPLTAVVSPRRGGYGRLPERGSFLSIDAGNVVVTALKKADDDDGVVVRVYEDARQDIVTSLRFMLPLESAETTDLIEEDGRPAVVDGDRLRFFLGHDSIRTMKLRPRLDARNPSVKAAPQRSR